MVPPAKLLLISRYFAQVMSKEAFEHLLESANRGNPIAKWHGSMLLRGGCRACQEATCDKHLIRTVIATDGTSGVGTATANRRLKAADARQALDFKPASRRHPSAKLQTAA